MPSITVTNARMILFLVSALLASRSVYGLTPGSLSGKRQKISPRIHLLKEKNSSINAGKTPDSKNLTLALGESAFTEGERLSLIGQKDAKIKAARFYEKAIQQWRKCGEKRRELVTLNTLGHLYETLGELHKALAYYNQAVLLNRQVADQILESESLKGCGYVSLYLSDRRKALTYLTQALALSRAIGDKQGEAECLAHLGEYYYFERDPKRSLEYQNLSYAINLELENRRGQAQNLLNYCRIYSFINKKEQSLEYHDKALSLWRLLGDGRGTALTQIAGAGIHTKMGDKQEAINLYNVTLKSILLSGDQLWEASIYAGLGYVYEEIGEADMALAYNRKAFELYKDIGMLRSLPLLLIKIGNHYNSLGQQQLALSYYSQVQAMNDLLEDKLVDAQLKQSMGEIYAQQGEREKALKYLYEALELSRNSEKLQFEAYMRNSLGNFYFHEKNYQKAQEFFLSALTINRRIEDNFGKVDTLYYLARVHKEKSEFTEARRYIEEGIRLGESLRDNIKGPGHRTSFFATVQKSFDLSIDLLMQQHKQNGTSGFNIEALELSERARARTFLEALLESRVDLGKGVDPDLLQREKELKQKIDERANFRDQLLAKVHTDSQVKAVNAEINELTAEREQVRARIRAASLNYSAVIFTRPINLKETQEILDSETVLLEYRLGDEQSYLWVVTQGELHSFTLPGRKEIEMVAQQALASITTPDFVSAGAKSRISAQAKKTSYDYQKPIELLSHILLGQAASLIQSKRLLIVADGVLQYVPFAMLPEPEGGSVGGGEVGRKANLPSAPPLVVSHEIVNLPSASVLAALRKEYGDRTRAAKSIAVIADPIFTKEDVHLYSRNRGVKMPASTSLLNRDVVRAFSDTGGKIKSRRILRLPFAREEADNILKLVTDGSALKAVGFDANLSKVKSLDLQQYRFIHFATHGLANSENPYLSGIVLSLFDEKGNPQAGFLRLQDISDLKLSAELVVLSACQTALGKEFRGEGLISLTRGFMQAGSKRVLASLWNVNDAVTADLMKRFYQGVLVEGLSPAAALRTTQIAMWKQKNKNAPYYWAAFVLEGEWQ